MTDRTNGNPPQSQDFGLVAIENAITFGGALYTSVNDFNAAFDHVVATLDDAVLLFKRDSFNTSAFLAITAIEETAKAHVGIFRRERPDGRAKGRDPLHDHRQKHRMAVLPTVFMGKRLQEALGPDACARLQRQAETDSFVGTREASLYCARSEGRFVTPRTAIEAARAWELLLLAIETLNDNLVGYTSHTMLKCAWIDEMFGQVVDLKLGILTSDS